MQGAEILTKFTADNSEVSNVVKKTEKEFDALAVAGVVAFSKIGSEFNNMIVDFVKGGIDYNAQMETMNVRLETLTGSAEEADKIMAQIKKDAVSTPFDVASLTQAESLLISTGISAEESRNTILALGEAVSGSGWGSSELERMARNLQQIKNVGKATAMDMQQFAGVIPIWQMLSDSTGLSVAELQKMDITYDMLVEAMGKASKEGGRFYGGMEKQSKTMAGATSNLKESWNVLKGELAQGVFEAIKGLIPPLTELFTWIGNNKDLVLAIIVPLITFTNTLLGLMIINGLKTAFISLWAAVGANPIVVVIALLAALVAGFMYVWKHCEAFRNFFIGLWNDIKTTVQSAVIEAVDIYENMFGGAIKAQIDMCIGVLKGLISFLKGVFTGDWKGAWEGISSIFTSIFDGVKNMFKGVINWIIDKFNWFIRQVNKIKFPDWDFLGSLAGKGFNFKELQKLATGTNYVPQDMVAMIHEGEAVVPKKFNPYANGTNFNSIVSSGTGNNIIVNIENNMEMDSLGQLVNNVKTFSGGAKNDYNYGMGR